MSRAPIEMPVEREVGDRTEVTHPAFGMISASRFSAQPGVTLHGSDFTHGHAISLRIAPSRVTRDLSTDRHHAHSLPYIEVQMSESQWATFVSTLNVGDGVPCTVEYVNGKEVPNLPPRNTRGSFDKEMTARLAELTEKVKAAMQKVEADLSGLSGKKRESVLAELRSLAQEVESNLPFVANQFDRHMERTVEKAKAEVAGYIQNETRRAGLVALNGTTPPLLALPEPDR